MKTPTTFEDLEFARHPRGMGVAARVYFDNGYGASVVRISFSYGGAEGLYEIAVLHGDADDHDITYNTPITGDVLSSLNEDDVTTALADIAALPWCKRGDPGTPDNTHGIGDVLGSICRMMGGL